MGFYATNKYACNKIILTLHHPNVFVRKNVAVKNSFTVEAFARPSLLCFHPSIRARIFFCIWARNESCIEPNGHMTECSRRRKRQAIKHIIRSLVDLVWKNMNVMRMRRIPPGLPVPNIYQIPVDKISFLDVLINPVVIKSFVVDSKIRITAGSYGGRWSARVVRFISQSAILKAVELLLIERSRDRRVR